jgi:hypothetical protein
MRCSWHQPGRPVSIVVGDNVATEIVWRAISVTPAGPDTRPWNKQYRLDVRSHNAERPELLSEITASSDQVESMRAMTVAPSRNGRAGVETLL